MSINPDDNLHYVGVEKIMFDHDSYGRTQIGNNWCWAACIEMLCHFYGCEISQHTIAGSVHGFNPDGSVPDIGADDQTITQKLNQSWTNSDGLVFNLKSKYFSGSPLAKTLVNELVMKKPVIVGYNTGSNLHAVLVTAVGFEFTPEGKLIVRKIVVRDPQPPSDCPDGRIVYSAKDFASRMTSAWFIRVQIKIK